jgi:hypothetical protein
MSERAAVVGAGSWGTALANLLAGKGIETVVWSYEAEVAEQIEREHVNRATWTGSGSPPRCAPPRRPGGGGAWRLAGALRLPVARGAGVMGARRRTWSPARWW